MANLQELRQKLHEQKNRLGLVGGRIDIIEYDESENDVSAHISPQGWNIEIAVKKGFNPIKDKLWDKMTLTKSPFFST